MEQEDEDVEDFDEFLDSNVPTLAPDEVVVDVCPLQPIILTAHAPLWKMNLLQIFEEKLFMIDGFHIFVYDLSEENVIKKFSQKVEVPTQQVPNKITKIQTAINQVKVAYLGSKPAMVLAGDCGKVIPQFS
jgi:hypothetical protein